MKAWWFASKGEVLGYGDGRKPEVGHSHTVEGSPELCEHGLHGSVRVLDALRYAESNILYRVSITGDVQVGKDKICGKRRTYLERVDIEDVLREFARKQALINIEKIKPYVTPENYALILEYLQTGKERLRGATYYAADSAAYSDAYYAAYSAAYSAVYSAADSAAYSAAHYAAYSDAYYAARSATHSATHYAAHNTARSAAYSKAWEEANEMLTKMIEEKMKCK